MNNYRRYTEIKKVIFEFRSRSFKVEISSLQRLQGGFGLNFRVSTVHPQPLQRQLFDLKPDVDCFLENGSSNNQNRKSKMCEKRIQFCCVNHFFDSLIRSGARGF